MLVQQMNSTMAWAPNSPKNKDSTLLLRKTKLLKEKRIPTY